MSGLAFLLLLATASGTFVSTPLSGYELEWSTNATHLSIGLKVTTSGWVGFGISASGAMSGSDIVTVTGAGIVEDGYVMDANSPLKDCQQDWHLTKRDVVGGVTTLKLERKLDTKDLQDHPLADTSLTSKVIMAYASNNAQAVGYHSANRAVTRINFFKSAADQLPAVPKGHDGYFDALSHNPADTSAAFSIPVPGNRGGPDTYTDYCVDVPANVLTSDVHVTHVFPEITDGNMMRVHHFLVYASTESCAQKSERPDGAAMIWAYGGPGTAPLSLPAEVGFRFSSGGYKSIWNNVHYFNNDDTKGIQDRSGVRMYYTRTMRANDMGVMVFGDQGVRMFGQSVRAGSSPLSQYKFQCTVSSVAAGKSVKVFGIEQHMHRDGFSFRSEVADSTGKVKRTTNQDFYRGDRQDTIEYLQPVELRSGDSVTTRCIFNTGETSVTGTLKYGLGSRDEMCMEFFYYYPSMGPLETTCDYQDDQSVFKGKTGITLASLARQFGKCSSSTSTGSGSASTSTGTGSASSSSSTSPGTATTSGATAGTLAVALLLALHRLSFF